MILLGLWRRRARRSRRVLPVVALCFLSGLAASADAAFPGDNGRLVYVGSDGLVTVNPDGTSPVPVTDWAEDGRQDWDPVWSPDGSRIAYATDRGLENKFGISVVGAAGGSETLISPEEPEPGCDEEPAWSPDGSQIAFTNLPSTGNGGCLSDDAAIWVMGSDGSDRAPLVSGPGVPSSPAWSPDGTKIAYSRASPAGIYVTSLADGSETPLTTEGLYPSWSPDGTKIVFEKYTGTPSQLWVVNADGTGEEFLAEGNQPAWSPDGTKISYWVPSPSGATVHVMNPDGTGDAVVTVGSDPDWGTGDAPGTGPTDPPPTDPPPTGAGCPLPPGTTFPVYMAPVSVDVPIPVKPYRVVYGELNLTFTTRAPDPGAYCTLDSSAGELPVELDLPLLPPVQVAISTTTATVDFLVANPVGAPACNFMLSEEFFDGVIEEDCYLNRPALVGERTLRWRSPGFTIRAADPLGGLPDLTRGPLSFYVNLDALGPPLGIATETHRAETFIHRNLISRLPEVDKIAVFQDPPAEVAVVDGRGRRAGQIGDQRLRRGIPGAIYLRSRRNKALVIPYPRDGRYRVILSDKPRNRFHLAASVVDFSGTDRRPVIVSQRSYRGRLDRRGLAERRFVIDTKAPRLRVSVRRSYSRRVVLRRGLRLRTRCSEPCRVRAVALHDGRRVGAGRTTSLRPGERLVIVRFGRAGRSLLRRARAARLTLQVTALDSRGYERTVEHRVGLRR